MYSVHNYMMIVGDIPSLQASSSWQLVVLSTPEDLAAGLCVLFTSHGVRESHDTTLCTVT